jgi:glycine cleavage system protein P-like pyridoxal-binding family
MKSMKPQANVPNLDAEEGDALMAFWARHQRGRHAKVLFPEGGRGTVSATAALANYASNKATAISCRERGDILAAQLYEGIADRIYASLPDFARW